MKNLKPIQVFLVMLFLFEIAYFIYKAVIATTTDWTKVDDETIESIYKQVGK